MTSTAESLGQETQPASIAAYESLISPEGVQAFRRQIADEAGSFHYDREMADLGAAEAAISAQIKALDQDYSIDEATRMGRARELAQYSSDYADRQKVVNRLQTFMYNRQYQWDNHGRMVFDCHEPQVVPLAQALTAAATAHDSFVPPAAFKEMVDETSRVVEIDAHHKPLEFPLGAVVSAKGFESWDGRGHRSLKNDRPSREVIEDYAGRDTDIPPIDQATALILPDGQVVLMTHNSHRTAAARLKNQAAIGIKYLTVVRAKPDAALPATRH